MIGDLAWADERYVRIYCRDTADALALSFEARSLYLHLARKADRAGVIPLGRHGKRAAAVLVGATHLWPTLEPALEELLADGCLSLSEDGQTLVFRDWEASQSSRASDKQRKQEERGRRADNARAVAAGARTPPEGAPEPAPTPSPESPPAPVAQLVKPPTPAPAPVPESDRESSAQTPQARQAQGQQLSLVEETVASQAGEHRAPVSVAAHAAIESKKTRKPTNAAESKKTDEYKQPDPRHRQLTQEMATIYLEVRNTKWDWSPREAKAISGLLEKADKSLTLDHAAHDPRGSAEVLRRWKIALTHPFKSRSYPRELLDQWAVFEQPHPTPSSRRAPTPHPAHYREGEVAL